jgi:hypothetical protein
MEQQQLMIECMKPTFPGPKIVVSYKDSSVGSRKNELDLPIVVTTFNEPLQLAGPDFETRWSQLTATGQETQETYSFSKSLNVLQIRDALVSVSIFYPLKKMINILQT